MGTELKLNLKALGIGQFTKVVDKLHEANTEFTDLKKIMDDNKKSMSGLADNRITRFFDKLNGRIFDVARSQTMLAKAGGQFGLMSTKIGEMNAQMEALGAKSILQKIQLLGSTLTKAFLPIALITAGIYLLSRVWKENIGGIQSKWIEFTGRLRTTWNKFDESVRRFLRTMEPFFERIAKNGFALLEGVFEGFLISVKLIGNILIPVYNTLNKIFNFNKDAKDSSDTWKAIGYTLGSVILPALLGFMVIAKIIAFVKALSAAFTVFNIIVAANPIGATVLAVIVLIGLVVLLQKKFNIFGKALEGYKILFKLLGKLLYNTLIKPFVDAFKVFQKAYDLGKKAAKFIGLGGDDEPEDAASDRVASSVSKASNTNSTSNDNRSATVTIHTATMDTAQASNIGNAFINPVLDANKQI